MKELCYICEIREFRSP